MYQEESSIRKRYIPGKKLMHRAHMELEVWFNMEGFREFLTIKYIEHISSHEQYKDLLNKRLPRILV